MSTGLRIRSIGIRDAKKDHKKEAEMRAARKGKAAEKGKENTKGESGRAGK